MRYPQDVHNVRRVIEEVVASLERFGQYDFRTNGFIKISRWKGNRALDAYKSTLINVPGKVEGEPPSATMTQDVQVTWNAEADEIGKTIRQRHVGTIRPQLRHMVDVWYKSGKPFPSSGGLYYTIPNKSYTKIRDLMQFPELRDSILHLGLEEEWIQFWENYLPLRHDVSAALLQLVQTGADSEALSLGNEAAGTGLSIRGRRLSRADLASVSRELDFLLPYSFALGIAFAAVQLAKLEDPRDVWMIEVYDTRIKGAVASRSDMDVKEVGWDGERLTIEGVTKTRQAGSDASGVLANSRTERKLMGASVTERFLRQFKHDKVEYPFTNRRLLLDVWAADAKRFPGRPYVIGEDLGLMEPVSSPADALFSRGFYKIANKVVPLMLSGSNWTQAVYSVFHNHYAKKFADADKLLALGDDMNLLTFETEDEVFNPYVKVKGTIPELNVKKILGLYTKMELSPDPDQNANAVIGVVPRCLKTVSSATKLKSHWGETLSDLGDSGTLQLVHPETVEQSIAEDLETILPYQFWQGPRHELRMRLETLWGHIPHNVWQVLTRYNDELEYRLNPSESYQESE